MKRFTGLILVLIMITCLLLPSIPVEVSAAPIEYFEAMKDFSGLQFSLIGDSISTYDGVSNTKTYNPLYLSTSEATFGSYYGNSGHPSYGTFSQVTRAETWWQQTVDTLGMNLLVNSSWAGSYCLYDNASANSTEFPAAGYKDRSVNLHYGSKTPDVIAVYMGTNDVGDYASGTVGNVSDVDTASERSALYTSVNEYATPSTTILPVQKIQK